MAQYNISVSGNQLIIELIVTGGDFAPSIVSIKNPSIKLTTDRIKFYDSGVYNMALFFNQINEIDGVAPTDLEDATDKIIALIANFNGGGAAPSYKVYTAEFNQTSKQSISSGSLIAGVKYFIPFIALGDDFMNIGADGNYDGVEFIATGTTPTNWTNGTPVYFNYDPVVNVLENTLGELVLTINNPGHYKYQSPLFIAEKTFIFNSSSLSGDLNPTEFIKTFTDGNNVFIELYNVYIDNGVLNYVTASLYEKFTIEIRVYN